MAPLSAFPCTQVQLLVIEAMVFKADRCRKFGINKKNIYVIFTKTQVEKAANSNFAWNSNWKWDVDGHGPTPSKELFPKATSDRLKGTLYNTISHRALSHFHLIIFFCSLHCIGLPSFFFKFISFVAWPCILDFAVFYFRCVFLCFEFCSDLFSLCFSLL